MITPRKYLFLYHPWQWASTIAIKWTSSKGLKTCMTHIEGMPTLIGYTPVGVGVIACPIFPDVISPFLTLFFHLLLLNVLIVHRVLTVHYNRYIIVHAILIYFAYNYITVHFVFVCLLSSPGEGGVSLWCASPSGARIVIPRTVLV